MFRFKLGLKNAPLTQLLHRQLMTHFSLSTQTDADDHDQLILNSEPTKEVLDFIEDFQKQVGNFAHRAQEKSVAQFGTDLERSLDHHSVNDACHQISKGVYSYHGEFLQIIEDLDQLILGQFQQTRPQSISLPEIIEETDLIRLGYLPRDIRQVASLQVVPSGAPNCCLTPAVCLPFYRQLSYWVKNTDNRQCFTVRGRAHRHEGGNQTTDNPMLRLRLFQVRELIELSKEESTEFIKQQFLSLAATISDEFKLHIEIETASDIFFEPSDSKLAVQQLLAQSKWEMRVTIANQSLSLASLNLHDDHFTSKYLGPDSGYKTNCIGVGLERAAYAIYCQRKALK